MRGFFVPMLILFRKRLDTPASLTPADPSRAVSAIVRRHNSQEHP